jgi:hypothetical protein
MMASAVLDDRSGLMEQPNFPESRLYMLSGQTESGAPIGGLCRQCGIAEQTFYTREKK